MKILQLVPYFYPAWSYGGPAKLVYDISSYFAKQGHSVTVYTSDAYSKEERMPQKLHVVQKNLTVHYFWNFNNFLTYTYNVFFTPGLYFKALWQVKAFDVIHIHDFYSLQNFYVGLLARLFKIPYILSVHGCLEKERLEQRSLFKQFFLHLYGYQLLRHAATLIASSENEYASFRSLNIPKNKIARMGHGINSEEFQTKATKAESRKYLKLPKEACIVTFLGRIHKIKGLDRLLKAIELLKNEQNLFFVIAGSDDGYLSELKKVMSTHSLKNVKLFGTSFGENKNKLFKASDIFIYPSYSEGFSLGILEAAAAGLPLILSTGCHFEEVGSHKAGLIVENEPKKLRNAILKLLQNAALRKEFSKNAQQLIENKYSMSAIGNQLITLYEKTL